MTFSQVQSRITKVEQYVCDICGNPYETQRKAGECVEACLDNCMTTAEDPTVTRVKG